jgi:integrase
MRPGEIDAMRWDWLDLDANRIHVREQWNVKARTWSLPKNDKTRTILLTPQAREALMRAPKDGPFCFANLRGNHWTPSARNHHWDRVRTKMGWLERDSRVALYLATRDISPAGFSTTSSSYPRRMSRSSLGMRMAASWSACCTGIVIGRGRWLGLSGRSLRGLPRMWRLARCG